LEASKFIILFDSFRVNSNFKTRKIIINNFYFLPLVLIVFFLSL
jgi:hypothetical protein